jgi:hypothetical protein
LLDGCCCHHSDGFLDIFHSTPASHQFSAPGSSQPIQLLQRGFSRYTYQEICSQSWVSGHLLQMTKIIGVSRAIATLPNITSAFTPDMPATRDIARLICPCVQYPESRARGKRDNLDADSSEWKSGCDRDFRQITH